MKCGCVYFAQNFVQNPENGWTKDENKENKTLWAFDGGDHKKDENGQFGVIQKAHFENP